MILFPKHKIDDPLKQNTRFGKGQKNFVGAISAGLGALGAAGAGGAAGGTFGAAGASSVLDSGGGFFSSMGGVSGAIGGASGIMGLIGQGAALTQALDGAAGTSMKRISTLDPQQSQLYQMLSSRAMQGQNYRPYPGKTVRTSPTSNEQGIFDRIPSMMNKIGSNQQPANAGAARQAAGAGVQKQAQKSQSMQDVPDIINKGQSQIISKILSILNPQSGSSSGGGQ